MSHSTIEDLLRLHGVEILLSLETVRTRSTGFNAQVMSIWTGLVFSVHDAARLSPITGASDWAPCRKSMCGRKEANTLVWCGNAKRCGTLFATRTHGGSSPGWRAQKNESSITRRDQHHEIMRLRHAGQRVLALRTLGSSCTRWGNFVFDYC